MSVQAQQTTPIPSSPNAASLGRYGDIAVGGYTGIPQISIPLGTVKGKHMSLPVSLSYHAAGVKVDDIAGNVGLGWSLNAGGVITRTIKGKPDELTGGFATYDFDKTNTAHLQGAALNTIDTEPDAFFFNVNGLSGKFVLDRAGGQAVVRLIPFQDVKIVMTALGFTMTGPDGTKYYFETPEYTYTLDQALSEITNITSWYLSRMEDITGDVINFQYNTTGNSVRYTPGLSQTLLIPAAGNSQACGPSVNITPLNPGDGAFRAGEFTYEYNEGTINSSTTGLQVNSPNIRVDLTTLTSITSFHDQVNFLYADRQDFAAGAQAVSKIIFNNKNYQQINTYIPVKRVDLVYDYFLSAGDGAALGLDPVSIARNNKRLKLIQLKETGINADLSEISTPPHQFDYYDDGAINLPSRLSYKQDHWGFANNNPAQWLIPKRLDNSNLYDKADRSASADRTKAGVIKKITYPTGGYTEFEFEAHTIPYSDAVESVTAQYVRADASSISDYFFNHAAMSDATYFTIQQDQVVDVYYNLCGPSPDYYGCVKLSHCDASGNTIGSPVFIQNAIPINASQSLKTSPFLSAGKYKVESSVGGNAPVNGKAERSTIDVWYYNVMNANTTMPTNSVVGGVRIKRIKTFENPSASPIIKRYEYLDINNPALSSGHLVSLPKYDFTQKYAILSTSSSVNYETGQYCNVLGMASSSKVPLGSTQGSHIGYQYVTVYDGENGENGKSVMTYSTYDDALNNRIPFAQNDSYDWRRGNLEQQIDYKRANNQPAGALVEVKRVTNVYKNDRTTNFFNKKGYVIAFTYPNVVTIPSTLSALLDKLNINDYNTLCTWSSLLSTTTILDGVTTTTNYDYDETNGRHTQPLTTHTWNSKGQEIKTATVYTKDLPASTDPGISACNSLNILAPLEQRTYVNSFLTGGLKNKYSVVTVNGRNIPLQTSWVNILRDNSEVIQFTAAYQPVDGFLQSQTQKGFTVPKTYVWANGLVMSETFDVLTKTYTYKPSTRLVETVTDEFGLTARFSYDGLQRLIKTEGMFTDASLATPKAVSTYSYQYAANSLPNAITSATTFYDPDMTRTLTNIGYIDGIGRSIQTVKQNYAQDGSNVQAGFTSYDAFGRPCQTYQPEKTPASYSAAPVSPYFQTTQYEASPLNRVVKNIKEDNSAVLTAYDKNGANEVFLFNASATVATSYASLTPVSASSAGYYAAGTLYKITTTDENNHQTIQFKDLLGRVILSRRVSSGGNIDTYYIYDDYGKLAAVAPPGSVDGVGNINPAMIYQYNYDLQNRLTQKKIPGAGWQFLRYDARDLPVLTQDANMRASNSTKCVATLYDNIGRPTETGFCYQNLDSYTEGAALPINGGDDLTYTYYYGAGQAVGQRNKVSQTTSRVLGVRTDYGHDAYMITKNYSYDVYGRAVSTSENTSNSFNLFSSMTYLFSGKATSASRNFQGVWGMDWNTNDATTYDNKGRPNNVTHQFLRSGGQRTYPNPWTWSLPAQTVSGNPTYDGQDRIVMKNIGLSNGNWLQSPVYNFNARGWLSKINDPTVYNTSNSYYYWNTRLLTTTEAFTSIHSSNPQQAPDYTGYKNNMDLFDEDIHYYDTNGSVGASQAQYNGNISYVIWKVAGREKQGYAYQYDDLDRLTNAAYADMQDYNYSNNYSPYTTDNKFGESATYDVRGNIKTLQRRGLQQYGTNNGFAAGVFGQIDNLTYTYGNANNPDWLTGVYDASGSAKGFGQNGSSAAYAYDANGNLLTDNNKGITGIDYNYLNLPQTIYFGSVARIDFLYDANGNKLKKTVTKADWSSTYKYYADGVEFDNMYYAPTTFYTSEGRLNYDANANAWYYEYSLKDHLGNTRVVFADRNGDGKIDPFSEVSQINHFYPFGLNMEGNWNGAAGAFKKQYNGKEWNDDLGLNMNDYGARWYDPALARWSVIDPLIEIAHYSSPYIYVENNPIIKNDPTGMSSNSTHIDRNGKVVAVYNDGDNGVYQHNDLPTDYAKQDNEKDKDGKSKRKLTGGKSIGQTEYWDEFANLTSKAPEGWLVLDSRPQADWDFIVNWMHEDAMHYELTEIAEMSKLHKKYDLKNLESWTLSEPGVMTGRRLNGKWATARSAGNFLAGWNGSTGTLYGKHIDMKTYLKLAGALNVGKYSKFNIGLILTRDVSFGPPPYYGEDEYSGRRIINGWNFKGFLKP